jgi:hypothetical protein
MRRVVFMVVLLILVALPLYAQRHGVSSAPRVGASVAIRPHGGFGIANRGGFGFRGGIAFGHNPGFRVFFNQRPFHRRSFYPYSYYPYGLAYPYSIYPYYGLGYQSDFVYSGSAGQSQAAYMADHDAGLQSDVYRLQAELDQLRQEQALRAEHQPYVSQSLTQTPRPSQAARPEPPPPPTVLIYRDGHKAEVHNYAIAGPTLWIFSEERARKVPLADLDLDATHKANEERGVDFTVNANLPH